MHWSWDCPASTPQAPSPANCPRMAAARRCSYTRSAQPPGTREPAASGACCQSAGRSRHDRAESRRVSVNRSPIPRLVPRPGAAIGSIPWFAPQASLSVNRWPIPRLVPRPGAGHQLSIPMVRSASVAQRQSMADPSARASPGSDHQLSIPLGRSASVAQRQSNRSRTTIVSSRPGPTPIAEIGALIIFSRAST